MSREERELGRAFERLRRHEAARVPPFERVWAAARRRRAAAEPAPRDPWRRALPAAVATAALVVVALVAFLFVDRLPWAAAPAADDRAALELARELSSWSSPLDFLDSPRRDRFASPLAPGATEKFLELLHPAAAGADAGTGPGDPSLEPNPRLWEEI